MCTLLSSEQTAIVYSDIEMLYLDESTFTLHDVVSVCLEQIVNMSQPAPLAINKVTNHRFVGLTHEVFFEFVQLICLFYYY